MNIPLNTHNFIGNIDKVSDKTKELAEWLQTHSVYIPKRIRILDNNLIEFLYENRYRDSLFIEIGHHYHCWWMKNIDATCHHRLAAAKENIYSLLNLIKLFMGGHPKNPILFTGAFNPPTIAHYHMIQSAFNDGFDYVIFAVSNQEFLQKKQQKGDGIAYTEQQRLAMITEMTWQNPNVLIHGVEEGYTYDVLNGTIRHFDLSKLSFAMGSDKLKEIEHWGHHEELLRRFGFYVMQREESSEWTRKECERIFKYTFYKIGLPETAYTNVSATLVRKKQRSGENYQELVHPFVHRYLQNMNENREPAC